MKVTLAETTRPPLLTRRGGRDIKTMPPSFLKRMPRSFLIWSGRGGRSQRSWLVSDHPVCGAKVGFAEIFLMPQPPLLTRRGMRLLQTAEQFVHGSVRDLCFEYALI